MNLIEALKTGKPLRRPIAKHKGSNGNGWLGSEFILGLITPNYKSVQIPFYPVSYIIDRYDILSEDWEIKNEENQIEH